MQLQLCAAMATLITSPQASGAAVENFHTMQPFSCVAIAILHQRLVHYHGAVVGLATMLTYLCVVVTTTCSS